MKVIQKSLKLTKERYYEIHLAIVNALLPIKMTPREVEVLAHFMSLSGAIVEREKFGTSARKIVKANLNLSDGGLGNYLKSLKDKRFIVEEGGILNVHPILQPENKEQLYHFRLENIDA